MHRFLDVLARYRNRRITVLETSMRPATSYCMVISTAEIDYVVHATDTTTPRGQRDDVRDVCELFLQLPHWDSQPFVRSLLPTLSPALVRRVLGLTD